MRLPCRLPSRTRRTLTCLWPLAVWLLAGLVGCRQEPAPQASSPPPSSATTPQLERDHFAMAIDFLKQRDEHNMERSAGQTNYYLNRWARDQTADPRWMIDRRIFSTLPDAIKRAPATKELTSDHVLATLEFHPGDVMFLEENRWLHAIAQGVGQQPPPAALAQWIKDSGLSAKSARNLTSCIALFDWTVRNIQLDALRPYPKQSVAGPLSPQESDASMVDWPPPMRGVPGPGYEEDPWHVLLYGRGDAYQRARIFILLARQLRIEVVMLGIDRKTGRAEEWLPAVVLDKQLFLFDPELGLPIPGPGGVGIATLAQVIADPQLLESLDVGDKYRYRVRRADLDKVVALLDASTEYLSQRMRLVEQNLDAADQMVLSVSTADLKKELEGCQGVTDVRLWALPLETDMYRRMRTSMMSADQQMQWQEFLDHGVLQGLSTVARGRRQHLLGKLEKQGDKPGATAYYLAARMSDAQIADMKTNRDLQKSLGLEKTVGMLDREWEQRLQQVQRLQIESKQHAAYWLGLTHQEEKDYEVAANWLKVRTLDADPAGPWTAGARYNLARCYEALGRIDEARQLYLIDESPQRHGCLLRARQLEAQAAADAAKQ
ncbi:MAG: tetratricopeptide repeat protein [Pirellulaceae bacterium]